MNMENRIKNSRVCDLNFLQRLSQKRTPHY